MPEIDPGAYPWIKDYSPGESLSLRVPPPKGYVRARAGKGSFGEWLRRLPLKPGRPEVMLYDGRSKPNQTVHHAVIDMDVGRRDLQQCADAVIRLRAEYLLAVGRIRDIHFNFTSGDRADLARWREGVRPIVRGNEVSWARTARPDDSYENFREYLDEVFTYAGTASLRRELLHVASPEDMKIGDLFIRGGHPGHAVIVLDMAKDGKNRKVFLLAQSHMPAQDIHVLRNPRDTELSPWYATDFGAALQTPEWTFNRNELMRFAE